jgi:hypothetical protein
MEDDACLAYAQWLNPRIRSIQIIADRKEDFSHNLTAKSITCPINSEEHDVTYNLEN